MSDPNAQIKASKNSWPFNNVPLSGTAADARLHGTSTPEPHAVRVSTVFIIRRKQFRGRKQRWAWNSLSYQKPKRLSKIIMGISRLRSQLEKPPIGQRWDKNSNCTELKHIKYFKSGEEGKSIMTLKIKKEKGYLWRMPGNCQGFPRPPPG